MPKKRANPKGGSISQQVDKGLTPDKAKDGIMNTVSPVPCKVQYKRAQNETVITGDSCGYIVLGKDRPDSDASGYGGDGYAGLSEEAIDSSRVEIVVGRAASAKNGKGLEPGTFVDNSIPHDAARIYVCETTDVDKNFGLVQGLVGNAVGKSAVAIKSDHTRIIGREGIKIVTGKMKNIKAGLKGETNSKGGKLPSAPGIDLIAGNNAAPYTVRGPNLIPETIQRLQPVVVAYNMRDCMSELDGILDDIMAAIQQLSFCVTRGAHSTAAALSTLTAVPGAGAICGAASANLVAEAARSMAFVCSPIHQARATKLAWSTDYLQQFSYKFIGSRSVRATY